MLFQSSRPSVKSVSDKSSLRARPCSSDSEPFFRRIVFQNRFKHLHFKAPATSWERGTPIEPIETGDLHARPRADSMMAILNTDPIAPSERLAKSRVKLSNDVYFGMARGQSPGRPPRHIPMPGEAIIRKHTNKNAHAYAPALWRLDYLETDPTARRRRDFEREYGLKGYSQEESRAYYQAWDNFVARERRDRSQPQLKKKAGPGRVKEVWKQFKDLW